MPSQNVHIIAKSGGGGGDKRVEGLAFRESAASLAALRPRSEKKTSMIMATLTMRPARGVSSPLELVRTLAVPGLADVVKAHLGRFRQAEARRNT